MRSEAEIEWARVAPGRIVVATARDASVHCPHEDTPADLFAVPMRHWGTAGTTRWLLDGSIGAAAFGRSRARLNAPLTPLRWLWRLAGYYLTTSATSRLLPIAARRFGAAGRRALQRWAETGTREERGHDLLALRDIRALGYDPEVVIARCQPHTVTAIVEYFTRSVLHSTNPIGCVGYSYALERLAAEKGQAEIAAVQKILPSGVDATRCLRVHSSAGSDAKHVAGTIAVVEHLSAAERASVAKACYETARLFYTPLRPEPTELQLQNLLAGDPADRP